MTTTNDNHPSTGRASALPVILLVLSMTAACFGPSGPSTSRVAEDVTPSVTSVWLVEDGPTPERGMLIRRLDLDTGSVRTVLELPPGRDAGTLLATDRTYLQVIWDAQPDIGQGHFQADPHLRIHDRDGTELYEVGRAGEADLTPDGARILWWVPTEVRTCGDDHHDDHDDDHDDEPCLVPDATIMAADPREPAEALEIGRAERVSNVGWFGSDNVIVFREDGNHTVLDPDGTEEPLPFDDLYLDHVPDPGLFLTVSDDLHVLRLRQRDGSVTWERDYGDWRVDSVLSRDGRSVLVYALEAHPDLTVTTKVEVVDIRGRVRELPETEADGEIHWTPAGDAFAYRRITHDNRFELMLCATADLHCSPVFSWTEGITILGLEGGDVS